MKYSVQKGEDAPAYLQLYRRLREDIVRQNYPFGARLPSKRLLAEESGVSTVTVEHAYALLCDEGYVEARERSGYFVSFRTENGFAAGGGRARHLLPASRPAAHPDFPFTVLSKAMRYVIGSMGEAILDRAPNAGCTELREAIRKYLARSRGLHASVGQIVIGSGSEYLYGLIVELLGRDRLYAVESPSYKKIEQVYRASDVRLQMLPLGADGIDSLALSRCRADVLHVSPYRSYPTGVTASASKRHEYLRWAQREGGLLIEDDFESEFSVSSKPEETLFSLSRQDNVIYMNTFSKIVSPSLRVGYMLLPVHLTERFTEKLGFYACTVPTYIQLVLAELIEGGDFERHINRVRRAKRRGL